MPPWARSPRRGAWPRVRRTAPIRLRRELPDAFDLAAAGHRRPEARQRAGIAVAGADVGAASIRGREAGHWKWLDDGRFTC